MNLKFMSMAAMVAMAMFTACSEDDNTPNPEPITISAIHLQTNLSVRLTVEPT